MPSDLYPEGNDSLCQLEWQKLETKQSAERRPLGNDVIVLFRLSRGYSRDSNKILLCNVFQHFTADRTKITSAASYRFLVLFSETFEQVLTQIQWSLVFESAQPRKRGPVSFLRWFEGFLAKARQGAKVHMSRVVDVVVSILVLTLMERPSLFSLPQR